MASIHDLKRNYKKELEEKKTIEETKKQQHREQLKLRRTQKENKLDFLKLVDPLKFLQLEKEKQIKQSAVATSKFSRHNSKPKEKIYITINGKITQNKTKSVQHRYPKDPKGPKVNISFIYKKDYFPLLSDFLPDDPKYKTLSEKQLQDFQKYKQRQKIKDQKKYIISKNNKNNSVNKIKKYNEKEIRQNATSRGDKFMIKRSMILSNLGEGVQNKYFDNAALNYKKRNECSTFQFIRVPVNLANYPDFTLVDILVYSVLRDIACNTDPHSFSIQNSKVLKIIPSNELENSAKVSIEKIRSYTGISPNVIKKSIDHLEELKIIKILKPSSQKSPGIIFTILRDFAQIQKEDLDEINKKNKIKEQLKELKLKSLKDWDAENYDFNEETI